MHFICIDIARNNICILIYLRCKNQHVRKCPSHRPVLPGVQERGEGKGEGKDGGGEGGGDGRGRIWQKGQVSLHHEEMVLDSTWRGGGVGEEPDQRLRRGQVGGREQRVSCIQRLSRDQRVSSTRRLSRDQVEDRGRRV